MQAGGSAPGRPGLLHACSLPAAWAGQRQWRILATDFGVGLDFLAAWRAWKDDPQRPSMLHFVALAESAVSGGELLRAAGDDAALLPLARLLEREWYGLLPGVHRLDFEQGHVLLTLAIGETRKLLRQQDFHADSVFLTTGDGLDLKALARCCRRGTAVAAWDIDGQLADGLPRHGFQMRPATGAPQTSGLIAGEFAPAWQPRGRQPQAPAVPGDCIVIGAGLAGAAAAASMARRGWRVTVLDASAAPASGASGLPAGLLVPHTSPDDNLLSRLSRAGVRATLQQARELLQAGRDWEPCGVLEHHVEGFARTSTAQSESKPDTESGAGVAAEAAVWTRGATASEKRAAGLGAAVAADWHEKAAWIAPGPLVQAWLAQPGVQYRPGARVTELTRHADRWQALDAAGAELASGEVVIVAAAMASGELLPGLALQAVRGQVTWALRHAQAQLPPFPVNGDGGFIPALPTPEGLAWLCGSSFERDAVDLTAREGDQQENMARLRRLLPSMAPALEASLGPESLRSWTGIRCASTDRRPLAGSVDAGGADGRWLSTAMGSRGLTFAVLCAELIAARIHHEPLPLARNLASALSLARQKKPAASRASARE